MRHCGHEYSGMLGGRVYPGWCGSWVGLEGYYTGTPSHPSQDPIFNIFLRLKPTHGQMKAILRYLVRFPR